MALDRTQFDLLVDAVPGVSPGTPWNKARIDSVILDPVDAAAAFINQSNTFTGDQTVDGDLFVTGEINPTRRFEQLPKINQLVGDPAGSRTLLSESLTAGMSLRHDESAGVGRIAVGNYDTQTYQPLIFEVESFQVHSGTSPAARVEHLRVHPSGGVTVGDAAFCTADPGMGVLVAQNGLGTTPLPPNVLTVNGGFPGDTTNFLRADGTFASPAAAPYYDYGEGTPANPPVDTVRMYAVDDSGFTFLEERDNAGRIIRTSRDTVAVGKVDEVGGITRGQCVYVSGATGSNRLLKKALATGRATTPAFGLAMESGAQNAYIRVLTSGLMGGLDTSAIPEGTRVFLSETTPGAITTTAPLAPNLTQRVGWVLRSHGTQGEIGVLPATALSEASWVTTHASMHALGGRDALTLDGSQITGTVPDAILSANVARVDLANTFALTQTINGDAVLATTSKLSFGPLAVSGNPFFKKSGSNVEFRNYNDTAFAQLRALYNAGDITAGTLPNARIQLTASPRLLGRGTAAAGAMEEITLGTGLTMAGTTLNASAASGDVVGPASAVADNLAAFSGTTGKLLKDSAIALANVPKLNAANVFTSTNEFSSLVVRRGTIPSVTWIETGAQTQVDKRVWEIRAENQSLFFHALYDDLWTVEASLLRLDRDGLVTVTNSLKVMNVITERNRTVPIGDHAAWTPTVTGVGGTATLMSNYSSRYSVVGKTCFVMLYAMVMLGAGCTAIQIGGLPYATANSGGYSGVPFQFWASEGTDTGMVRFDLSGQSTMNLYRDASGANAFPAASSMYIVVTAPYHIV